MWKKASQCKFCHLKPKYVIENSEKIDKLEKKLHNIETLKPKEEAANDRLAKEMDIKIETFEEKMNTFSEIVKEKDEIIKAWETKFQKIENSNQSKIWKLENINNELHIEK